MRFDGSNDPKEEGHDIPKVEAQDAPKGEGHVPKVQSGVEFSRDGKDSSASGSAPKLVTRDAPYVQPSGLYVPPGIILPKTMMKHIIIEKTAAFVANQGYPMEIDLKSEQSTNVHFDFLFMYDDLYAYYKLLLHGLTTGAYKPSGNEFNTASTENSDSSENEEGESYLHPSLVPKGTSSVLHANVPHSPTTARNMYSALVSKIKGVNSQEQQGEKANIVAPVIPTAVTGVQEGEPQELLTPAILTKIGNFANYVTNHGCIFEAIVKCSDDPWSAFLDSKHPFHWFYLHCKNRLRSDGNAIAALGKLPNTDESPRGKGIADEATNSNAAGASYATSLPMSAPGIPLANHATLQSRSTKLAPWVDAQIKEICKTNATFSQSKATTEDVDIGILPCSDSSSASSEPILVSAISPRTPEAELKEEPVMALSTLLNCDPKWGKTPTDKDESNSKQSEFHNPERSSGFKRLGQSNRKPETYNENGPIEVSIREEEKYRKRIEKRQRDSSIVKRKKENLVFQGYPHCCKPTPVSLRNKSEIKESSFLEEHAYRNRIERREEVSLLYFQGNSAPDVQMPPLEMKAVIPKIHTATGSQPQLSSLDPLWQNDIGKHHRTVSGIPPDSEIKTDSSFTGDDRLTNCNLEKKRSGKRSLSTSSRDMNETVASYSSSPKKKRSNKHSKKGKKRHSRDKEKSKRSKKSGNSKKRRH